MVLKFEGGDYMLKIGFDLEVLLQTLNCSAEFWILKFCLNKL